MKLSKTGPKRNNNLLVFAIPFLLVLTILAIVVFLTTEIKSRQNLAASRLNNALLYIVNNADELNSSIHSIFDNTKLSALAELSGVDIHLYGDDSLLFSNTNTTIPPEPSVLANLTSCEDILAGKSLWVTRADIAGASSLVGGCKAHNSDGATTTLSVSLKQPTIWQTPSFVILLVGLFCLMSTLPLTLMVILKRQGSVDSDYTGPAEAISKENNLDEKMQAVGSLAGGVVHDFNNVLSGIFAPVSLLEHKIANDKDIPPEKLASSLTIIRNSAERARRMVDQLLNISNRLDPVAAEVDLNSSVQQVIEVAKKTLDKSITISPVFYPEKALTIADSDQVEQIILHVCMNGSHAMTIMREDSDTWGGELRIRVDKNHVSEDFLTDVPEIDAGNYFVVTIEDSGVGIHPEIVPNIFVPFFSTKEKGMGSGLGLSMVYNITKQHKGFVRFSSEVGVGSSFSLYFPALQN